jgi:CTP synthase
MFIHVTLLPFIPTAGELKTKPTQHSVKKLQEYGIQPDMLLCRSQCEIPQNEKRKLALFCNVREERVISALDVDTIYQVPIAYSNEGMDVQVCKYFEIDCKEKPNLSKWKKIVETIRNPEGEVKIAVVGKYIQLLEAYKSVHEAIIHGGIANKHKVRIKWVNSEELTDENAKLYLSDVSGIIVPGGFGESGTEGKIAGVKYAREKQIPFLGIGFGMQFAVIETLRNIAGIKGAGTTEFGKPCEPVVDAKKGDKLCLGAQESVLSKGSLAARIYTDVKISERHSNRYEVNKEYENKLKDAGMVISAWSSDKTLPAIVEISEHPWFIGVQFHPELKSKPFDPHPLFVDFIKASIKQSRLI